MFGLSVATEIFQGSTARTWNCVWHIIHLIWTKLNHIRQPIMPKSRKRHHSRSRSRSRSHSRDRSHDRDDKHRKNDSHEKDRDGKRRKIESYDSPTHKRSVSSECAAQESPSSKDNLRANEINICNKKDGSSNEKDIKTSDENVKTKMEIQEIISSNHEGKKRSENNDTFTSPQQASVSNEGGDVCDNEQESGVTEEKTGLSQDISGIDEEDVKIEDSVIVLDGSNDKIDADEEESTLLKKNKLQITPKRVSSPKQLQKKLESEKKRKEKQLEKEEREKKRNEEKERIKQEKLKKKKEKEMKEEHRKREKEEKEEQKRKEREEKEQKRKEKEEREEQKRKEREQEKLKRQLEIEEKNKEKQKEEEKKQKAAAAFVNFFVSKKPDNNQDERKSEVTQPYAFKAFEIKSDMKLPPARRNPLTEKERETLENYFENQHNAVSYIKELKSGKPTGKSFKTWPFEETIDDDVTFVEDEGNLGETICEDKPKLQKLRAKFLKFHENRRPAYFGTWRKKSKSVTPRRPFAEDTEVFNYEEDSDDDWEEEEQGESLNGSDDEADKENEDEKDDYEVDNEFFVPHGHLSDDEIDDEETSRLSPESLKQKLKLLKDEFDQDMQSKTHKLKPRSIGCIWYNEDGSNVEEAILRYLQPLAIISNGPIEVKKRTEIFTTNSKKNKPTRELDSEHIPLFLKVIHRNSNKKRVLVEQFLTYMANNGYNVDIAKGTLIRNINNLATWKKCKENGPMKNKFCWLVNDEVEKKYNLDLSSPNLL